MIIILIILAILFLGGFHPGVTGNYGYFPSGALGLILIVLLILLLMGRL